MHYTKNISDWLMFFFSFLAVAKKYYLPGYVLLIF